jgi:hypothetical protein
VPNDKEDKGFLIMGPPTENGGRTALRVDKDGVYAGELFKPGSAPEGDITRITTSPISGNIYQITEEEHIGKPSLVNSKAYRENWENIFGNKQVVGEA